MVQELDKSFDGVMLIGFHARGGSGGSPIEHTNDPGYVHVRINDLYASEFLIFAYAAAWVGVPVPFVSGDQALVDQVKTINPAYHHRGGEAGHRRVDPEYPPGPGSRAHP